MSEILTTLGDITQSLTRIEQKLDAFGGQFAQHVADDAVVAADVKALARQRGYFLSGFTAIGAGIAAAADYAIKRLTLGHH